MPTRSSTASLTWIWPRYWTSWGSLDRKTDTFISRECMERKTHYEMVAPYRERRLSSKIHHRNAYIYVYVEFGPTRHQHRATGSWKQPYDITTPSRFHRASYRTKPGGPKSARKKISAMKNMSARRNHFMHCGGNRRVAINGCIEMTCMSRWPKWNAMQA